MGISTVRGVRVRQNFQYKLTFSLLKSKYKQKKDSSIRIKHSENSPKKEQ